MCTKRSNWQQVSIGSGNGLVSLRHQAITGTNASHDVFCHKVPLGLNELTDAQESLHECLVTVYHWYTTMAAEQ